MRYPILLSNVTEYDNCFRYAPSSIKHSCYTIYIFSSDNTMAPSSVLVTGGGRGLGLEMIRQMLSSASPPLHLIATYRNPATAAPLLDLASTNPSLTPLQLDVTAHETHPTLVSQVQQVVGEQGLNLLVNNAGIGKMPRSLQSITPEEMMQHFQTNCVAPLFLSRSLLPLLKKAAGPDGKGKPLLGISFLLSSASFFNTTFPPNTTFPFPSLISFLLIPTIFSFYLSRTAQ